jgi:hypothetical protein
MRSPLADQVPTRRSRHSRGHECPRPTRVAAPAPQGVSHLVTTTELPMPLQTPLACGAASANVQLQGS